MTCPHCDARIADLEDEVRFLRRELGQMTDDATVTKISDAMRLRSGVGRPGAARVLALLWQAQGRPVSRYTLLEGTPPQDVTADPLDRMSNIVAIWVGMIRQCFGKDAVGTQYGKGYYLTPVGLARVSEILGKCSARSGQGAG